MIMIEFMSPLSPPAAEAQTIKPLPADALGGNYIEFLMNLKKTKYIHIYYPKVIE